MFGADLDVGERLYARNTAASLRKRANSKNTQVLDAAWSTFREQGIDVKSEVDRMFSSIMESIEGEPSFAAEPRDAEVATARYESMVLNETTNSRIAAAKALMQKRPVSMYRRTTFGSGRSGMSDPVSKADAPGPGQYHHDDENEGYSTGHHRRPPSSGGRSVSSSRIGSETSGTASSSNARAKRGYSFGTGKRTTFEGLVPGDNRAKQLSVPGPGEYKIPGAFDERRTAPHSTKGTFGAAARESEKRDATPGPGAYALDDCSSRVDQLLANAKATPAFSSSSPRMPSPRSVAPGPGTYHQVERGQSPPPVRDTPMYSFPKATPKGPESAAPGPGTYDLTTCHEDRQHRGAIPRAGRDDGVWGGKKKFEEPNPGPGAYNPADERSGLPITLKFRYDEKPNRVPGPGQYDYMIHEKTSGPLWTLGYRRPSPEPEVLPGPSDYMPTDESKPGGVVFGSARRDTHEDILPRIGIPGPGEYQPENVNAPSTKAAVFGTTRQRPDTVTGQAMPEVPGPGSYDPQEVRAGGPSGSLLTSAPRFMPSATDVPGPGYYSAIASALVEASRAPTAVIGDAKRDTSRHFIANAATTAGPGEYELPQLDRGLQYTMGLPLHPQHVEESDTRRGPGAYEVRSGKAEGNAPAAMIGTAVRFPESTNERNAKLVPGPGAYEPTPAERDPRSPVFGTASKEPPLQTGAPVGPGAYDPRDVHQSNIATSIGTAVRFDREKESAPHPVPGPGAYAYEPLSATGGGGAVFGTAAGHATQGAESDGPGPGAYDYVGAAQLTDARITRNAVLGTAAQRPEVRHEDGPGPAHYEPAPIAGHVPTPWINSRPVDRCEETPGPGLYHLTNLAEPTAPSTVFGTAPARHYNVPDDVPGPGAYAHQPPDDSTSPTFPLAARFPATGNEELPGPGSYEPTLPPGQGVSIGTAVRAKEAKDNGVPGPGAYNPEAPQADSAITINAAKRPEERPSDVPGPGAYTPQAIESNVHSTIFGVSAARPSAQRHEVPGPGAYQWVYMGPQGPIVSFPQASRNPRDYREDLPGPGYYDTNQPDASRQVHFLSAPRVTDLALRNDTPGPGQYHLSMDPLLAAHQGHSFPLAAQRPQVKSDAPGPGAYEQQQGRPTGPSYSFGTAPQHALLGDASIVPGPGAYDATLLSNAPAFSFGKWSRDQIAALMAQQVPGPGAYEVHMTPSGPVFTVGTAQRPGVAAPSFTPGPGAYADAARTPDTAAYSVPKAARFPSDRASELPGPGDYETVNTVGQSNMLGAVMGTAPRQRDVRTDDLVPGPGHYDPNVPGSEGPTFTFGTTSVRFQEKVDDVPGPASYEPRNPAMSPPPAAAIGTAPRFVASRGGDTPGPGAYEQYGNEGSGPAVSFPLAPRMDADLQRKAAQPGPGHYDPNRYAAVEGPSYSFGTSRHPAAGSGDPDLPGPGQYSVVEPFGADARAALIAPQPMVDADAVFARRVNATPGPTAYSLPPTLDQRGAPIGTAPRDPASADDRLQNPGPGAYVTGGVGMFDGPKYSIPREARRSDVGEGNDAVPGPGTYDGGRALDRLRAGAPVYSFPMAQRDVGPNEADDYRSALGPGAYNVGPAPHAGPAYSIPQGADFTGGGSGDTRGASAPGPGMYFKPTDWGVGGQTFGGKWAPRDPSSQVPGPGHYRVHDYDPYNRDQAIGIDFSKGGQRPCNVPVETVYSDMPGPGHYYRGAIQFGDGRGVSILRKIPEGFPERTPGPPDYHHAAMRHPFYDPLSH